MKYIISITVLLLASCTKDVVVDSSPCITGDCTVSLSINSIASPDAYIDANGYWNVPYTGSKYFTVDASYSRLKGAYVRGTLPFITTQWDSNYWFRIVGEVVMLSNLYNPLGSDYTYGFSVRYPSETREVTIDVSTIDELLNLSGRVMRDNTKGPMPSTKSTTKYTTSKPFVFLPQMVGDTIQITAYTDFAWDSDMPVEVENTINVILK